MEGLERPVRVVKIGCCSAEGLYHVQVPLKRLLLVPFPGPPECCSRCRELLYGHCVIVVSIIGYNMLLVGE